MKDRASRWLNATTAFRTNGFLIALTVGILLTLSNVSKGQDPVTVKVDAIAERVEDVHGRLLGWRVIVQFDTDFAESGTTDSSRYSNAGNYKIINISQTSVVPISVVRPLEVPGAIPSAVKLLVPSADAFDPKYLYHIYITGLLFNGKPTKGPVQGPISVAAKAPKDASGTAPVGSSADNSEDVPKATWALKSSKGRDDSDLYLSYEVTSVRHKPTTGAADLKIKIPFHQDFWKRSHMFSPFFEMKASSNASADPDSIKFGGEWRMPLYVGENPEATFWYTQVDLISSAGIEAPKDFDNVNAVGEERFLFPSANLLGRDRKVEMYLDPYVGYQFGRNLKSPLAIAKGNVISRLAFGANWKISIPINNAFILKGVDFESAYGRLIPFTRELTVKKKDDGTYTLLGFGKAPKDYSNSKFVVKVNDYFGPYIGYEWGRLPPNYNLVDHKWTFGLLFKTKVKAQ